MKSQPPGRTFPGCTGLEGVKARTSSGSAYNVSNFRKADNFNNCSSLWKPIYMPHKTKVSPFGNRLSSVLMEFVHWSIRSSHNLFSWNKKLKWMCHLTNYNTMRVFKSTKPLYNQFPGVPSHDIPLPRYHESCVWQVAIQSLPYWCKCTVESSQNNRGGYFDTSTSYPLTTQLSWVSLYWTSHDSYCYSSPPAYMLCFRRLDIDMADKWWNTVRNLPTREMIRVNIKTGLTEYRNFRTSISRLCREDVSALADRFWRRRIHRLPMCAGLEVRLFACWPL